MHRIKTPILTTLLLVLLVFTLPAAAQEDRSQQIGALKSILLNYRGFGPVKAVIKSEYKHKDDAKSAKLDPFYQKELITFLVNQGLCQ